jgi:hypothetical protein
MALTEKAVIALRIEPSEFDVLRDAVRNELARAKETLGGNPDDLGEARERAGQLQFLLTKLT